MKTVIISDKKSALGNYIKDSLLLKDNCAVISREEIITPTALCRLMLITSGDIKYIKGDSPVIILTESSYFSADMNIASAPLFIVDSQDKGHIEMLSKTAYPVITCGISGTDTISYTSISDGFITLSLNRQLVSFQQRMITPFEMPVEFTGEYPVYYVLSAFALRLLLDDFENYKDNLF